MSDSRAAVIVTEEDGVKTVTITANTATTNVALAQRLVRRVSPEMWPDDANVEDVKP
tara:strand:- start:206 stop:376 length:171 start_codon:yes stop_codon:yes gene_type:complete